MASEVESDDRFLADLTAFLDEFDASTITGDNGVEGAGYGSKTARRRKKKKGEKLSPEQLRERRILLARTRKTRYRQKMKSERQWLLQQQSELSAQLTRLQAQTTNKPRDSQLLSAWKSIAKLQKEKRIEVEHQQRHLRALMRNRASIIQQLQGLLARQYTKVIPRRSLPATMFEGAVLLDTLVRQLDSLYAQTDRVYRDLEFQTSTALTYNPKRRVNGDVEVFESTDAIAIPFRFDKAGQAMSTVVLSHLSGERYESVQDPDNTTAMRYCVNSRCESGEVVPLWVYTAARRYHEAYRTVFAWRMVVEGLDHFSGLNSDEMGWVVVRPESSSCTVGEIYSRLALLTLGKAQNDKQLLDRFTQIVLKTGEREVKEMAHQLDGLLLN